MDTFIEITEIIIFGVLIFLGLPVLWLVLFITRMMLRKEPSVLLNLVTISCNSLGYTVLIGWKFRTPEPLKFHGNELRFEDLSLTGNAAADETAILLFALSLLSVLMLSLFRPEKMPSWGKWTCLSSVGLGLLIQGLWLLKFCFCYAPLPPAGPDPVLPALMSLYHINYLFMAVGQLRRYWKKRKAAVQSTCPPNAFSTNQALIVERRD
ncbi:MAG: hypothetical protein IJ496_03645 [Ruminococcus sp.]|nr:hypothetical protein [Ruminococcus sp.]